MITFLKFGHPQYTLPQKKRKFNFQIFRGDPGPGSVNPGHVHQGKLTYTPPQKKGNFRKVAFLLGTSVYSTVYESSDKKKSWISSIFFHFFPWHSMPGNLFTISVRFLLRDHRNLLKTTRSSQPQSANTVFFLRRTDKTSVRICRP